MDVVSDAVLRSRAGLADRGRGSSFLFLVSDLLHHSTFDADLWKENANWDAVLCSRAALTDCGRAAPSRSW